MRPLPKAALYGAFAAFLAAFAFWGARNPRLKIDSDPSTYLRFAEALARGHFHVDYPPDRVFAPFYPPDSIYKGTYTTIIKGGRGIAFYSIGYPLYLAPFIALFGLYGAFFANLLVWLALLVLLWAVTRRVFAGHPAGEAAALAAPALYWLWNREEVTYLLAPYRDPLAHALLLGAALCLLEHLRGRGARLLLLGGALFGFAVAVRETSILAALPLGALWAHRAIADRRLPRPRALAAAVLGAFLGVAPLLAQNWANTGSPFYPTQVLDAQVRMGNISDEDSERRFGMRGLKLEHFRTTEPALVRRLLQDFDPVFTGLLLAGVAAGARSPAVPWLLLPFIAVFTVFFGFWVKPMMRYVLVAQVAAVPLVALGAAAAAALAGRLLRRPGLPAALAGLLLAVTAAGLLARREPEAFGIAQAESFRRDLEAHVPAGGIVFAERPMRDVVDHLTRAHAVRPDDVVRRGRGLTFPVAARALLRDAPGLWFLDTADGDRSDGMDDTPATRERILDTFDLVPEARFSAGDYGAAELFGRESATLWRVVPWSRREATAALELPAGAGALLRIDGRELDGPVPARIRVGGTPVADRLDPGWNWLALPPRDEAGIGTLEISASRAIPSALSPRVFGGEERIVLEAGPASLPLDERFLSREFLRARIVPGQRALVGPGRVRVPAIGAPGTLAILSARARTRADDVAVRAVLAVGGAAVERVVAGRAWRPFAVPVPGPDPGGTTAEVTIAVGPVGGEPDEPLAFDRFVLLRVRPLGLPLRVDLGAPGDEPFAAAGLSEPERYLGEHTVRASDGAARIYLPLEPAAARREARLALEIFGLPAAVGDASVRIAVNGVALGEFAVAPERAQEIPCPVPAGALHGGVNEVRVDGTTWRPADYGAPDTRVLGVMIDALRLDPAPAGTGR